MNSHRAIRTQPLVSRRTVIGLAAAGIGLAACGKSGNTSESTSPATSDGVEAIAKDAYIFGYPLVLMDATRVAAETIAPANTFMHSVALPTPERREVVRDNLDTLYSTAWLDVSADPIVLQVPAMDPGRYWLMQMLDAWTNTVHNPSSIRPQVNSGGPPFTYIVTGPKWSGTVPDGMTRLSVPTPTVWLIGRIQVNGADDIPAVTALQQQLKMVPLGAWAKSKDAPSPSAQAPTGASEVAPPKQVLDMDAATFFTRMCAVMAVNPPPPEDEPAMKRFAAIGIRPSGSVHGVSTEQQAAAADAAKKEIATYTDPKTLNENGWRHNPEVGTYGINYPLRANVAWFGLGINLAQDAIYPSIFGNADRNGVPAKFRLHFPPGQLPPVDAFWSLTAYDADSYLVSNPANIYAIGHQVPVVADSDGSVDLAVQNEDPGASVPTGNWLPIPASGHFSLTMRLYAPKDVAIDGRWRPPVLTVAP
ncbi:DUF1254 domain-containing protein [Nocardia sp. CA-107356]|uniref:DUF1254 domain-containing protein n=1 Tax=Nocardia sp. CA-107356 TaxID=3239972 RepID=UPI003D8CF42D